MREEVKRILKLVQEGKLSADDAAELIEAFEAGEAADADTGAESSAAPPPPPGDAQKDPFKSLIETMEKIGKEGMDAVNWQDVSKQVRESAKKGVDALRVGIDQVSKGKVHFPWGGNHEQKEVTMPLSIPAGKTLRVDNACGDIKLIGGFDVGSVQAKAKISGGTPEDAKAKADSYTLIIEESEHMVIIRQPDVSGLDVDLEIQMPGTGSVEVRSKSGDIQVMDTKGAARIDGVSGDIRLRGLNGPVEINSTSGDISIEDATSASLTIENKSGDLSLYRIKGNINARTASGDVTLHNCGGKTFSVESVSGDVRVELDEPVTGTVNVRTVNGDATMVLMDGDCRVQLSTLRGSVVCDLPLQDENKSEQRITGRLGDGTGALDVSAVTGNITVRMRSET